MKRPFALRLATFGDGRAGSARRGTGSGRQARVRPPPLEHPPDDLRARCHWVRRPVRLAEDALHRKRLSGRLRSGLRVRLDLLGRIAGRCPGETRHLHRPGEAGDRPQAGRSAGSLAGHLRFPDLPQQLSRTRRERRPLREHRRRAGGLAAGRGTDSGHLGGHGDAGSLDRRGDQRHRPQSDARPVGDLSRSHSLRCSGSSPAIAPVPPTSCDSTARSRSPEGRCCSRRTSASRQAPR